MEDIKVNEVVEESTDNMSDDDLKQAIGDKLEEIRTQNLLLGAQVICSVILQKITTVLSKPGKTSLRDYERLVKDISEFCKTGLSRKVNLDGTTSPIEEDTNESNTSES